MAAVDPELCVSAGFSGGLALSPAVGPQSIMFWWMLFLVVGVTLLQLGYLDWRCWVFVSQSLVQLVLEFRQLLLHIRAHRFDLSEKYS